MLSSPTLTVISLGGGVQSTVMALMASEDAFDRTPDCAIFADTHWEPPSIYEASGMAQRPAELPPVRRGQRTQPPRRRESPHQPLGLTKLCGHPRLPQGTRRRGRRHRPQAVHRQLQDYDPSNAGYASCSDSGRGSRVPAGTGVELWLGISTDEIIRVKTSRDRWMTNRYPLIEAGMSRRDCLDWWGRPLRQAPGTLGLRRMPLPVTTAVGRDEAAVAGAVRRGGGDRLETKGRAGLRQGALPA